MFNSEKSCLLLILFNMEQYAIHIFAWYHKILMLLISLTLHGRSHPIVSQLPPLTDGGCFGRVCRVP